MSNSNRRDKRQKKTFYVQVGSQILILEVCITPDTTDKFSQAEKNPSTKCLCDWFKEIHLQELLRSLQNTVTTHVDSERPVTRATCHKSKCSSITTQSLEVSYCFKKRAISAQQFALLKDDKEIYRFNGKAKKKEKVNYDSLSFYHEKLVATVEKLTKSRKRQVRKVQPIETVEEKEKTMKNTSSNYFTESTDHLITASVKRKKTCLKKLAKKSKIALVKTPAYEPSGNIIQNQCDNESCHTRNRHSSSSNPRVEKKRTRSTESKTVIDLEEEPKGLKDIERVEDLQNDQLKFLINKMEDYLRTIFRGEVYSRRHEDYKKGGKTRDNLNFQVGMAHFSEDQHDCIMDALMAMFCYRHTKYLDYVTKVMLPEALIKLYQDIHNTNFETAEECLLNDTVS